MNIFARRATFRMNVSKATRCRYIHTIQLEGGSLDQGKRGGTTNHQLLHTYLHLAGSNTILHWSMPANILGRTRYIETPATRHAAKSVRKDTTDRERSVAALANVLS